MLLKINEVLCKSALSKSSLPGLTYSLNPYRGCEHACCYCYSPAVLREKREWGDFVDVKKNIPYVLSKELRVKKKGIVGLGTVTDAYQPLELKYEATRRCLEQLLKFDFPISIQTKSALVLRDLDLLRDFSKKDIGFTITALNDRYRRIFEPRSSPVGERLEALKKIGRMGIDTWVFIGPILPFVTIRNLEEFMSALASAKVKKVISDKLRLKPGILARILRRLETEDSELAERYRHLFSDGNDPFQAVEGKIESLCTEYGIRHELAFGKKAYSSILKAGRVNAILTRGS